MVKVYCELNYLQLFRSDIKELGITIRTQITDYVASFHLEEEDLNLIRLSLTDWAVKPGQGYIWNPSDDDYYIINSEARPRGIRTI